MSRTIIAWALARPFATSQVGMLARQFRVVGNDLIAHEVCLDSDPLRGTVGRLNCKV